MREAETRMEEVPASHKASFQRYAIVIGTLLVVVLAAAMYLQSSSKRERQEQAKIEQDALKLKKEQEQLLTRPRSPTAQFDEQLAQRRASALREAQSVPPVGAAETPPTDNAEAFARMEQQRDLARQQSSRSSKPGNASAEKDPIVEWRRREQLRALASATKPYNLGAAKTVELGSSRLEAGTSAKPTLEQRQSEVQRRLAAAEDMKRQIAAGAPPDAVMAQFRAINKPDPAVNIATASSASSASSRAHPASPLVVGYTEENAALYGELTTGKSLLATGTIIKAALAQDLISDYTGSFKCIITHDVYDPSYEQILIPKGSECTGKVMRIRNINEPIQARLGLAVNWSILPNGQRIDMRKGSVQDRSGVGAIAGSVNYHFVAQFLGVAAYAVLASETERSSSSDFTGEVDIEGDVGRSMREQFAPLAARYLTLVPTVTLSSGTPITIFVEDDIFIKPWATIYDHLVSTR